MAVLPANVTDPAYPLYALLLPSAPRIRSGNYTIEKGIFLGSHPTTVFSSTHHHSILCIVNSVWDADIASCIQSLASFLTFLPTSLYVNAPCLSATQYIRHTAKFVFIWKDCTSFLPARVTNASYAVMFKIECDIPYQSFCLAYLLLRFSEENIRDSDYHRFKIVGLTYQFFRTSVYGIAFYDAQFQPAFSHAMALSFLNTDGFSSFSDIDGVISPVLKWFSPAGFDHDVPNDSLIDLSVTARGLADW